MLVPFLHDEPTPLLLAQIKFCHGASIARSPRPTFCAVSSNSATAASESAVINWYCELIWSHVVTWGPEDRPAKVIPTELAARRPALWQNYSSDRNGSECYFLAVGAIFWPWGLPPRKTIRW